MQLFTAILPYLIGAAIVVVVASLFGGLVSMARGGAFNLRWGNTMMRVRVASQGAVLVLLALYFVLTRLV